MSPANHPAFYVRTAFISDIHLGSRDCRTDLILDFLQSVHADQLVLVGDIVDIWSLRRRFYWPPSHAEVLNALLGKVKQGTRIVYVPGNHDEQFRNLCGSSFGLLEVHREFVHHTVAGKRLLVMHGDEFDAAVKCNRLLAMLGSGLYDVALGLNRAVNSLRRRYGYGYWSLATYLKSRIGNAVQYVRHFEEAAAHHAHRRGLDGVVCGHIHRPAVTELEGVLYCNDGDWVDSCSALIERCDGKLELWHWLEVARQIAPARALPSAA